jgi:2-alkyl-3-oxoalkanoate reductase
LQSRGVDVCTGDIRDPAAVSQSLAGGFDAVIHTAAIAGIWGPWELYHKTNTVGTTNVIQACKLHGVQKLVFTSSPSVTFDGADQRNLSEANAKYPENWLCHYPHTKALAEQAVLAANREGELLTCSLRPHLIWGPGDPHLIPRLINRARSGRLRQVGEGTNLVDIIYVDNAALAHVQALDALRVGSPVCGSAYFLSQGEPVNCWRWINEILALVNLPAVTKKMPLSVARTVGLVLEQIYKLFQLKNEPPMTRFLAAQLGCDHYYDIARARKDFNYQPAVSTAEGMKRLGAWLKADTAN